MTVVVMFPGQSSRYPEMIAKLGDGELLAEASELLGRDLAAHYHAADPFRSNRDVQVGVFLANHMHLRALEAAGVRAPWSLGLSLGEYNHLVHIGALDFAAALRLVDARGRLYDEAQGGLMVSVFPLAASVIEAAIARLGLGARAGIGLYNSPRQQVISGERAAVEELLAYLERDEYFDATVIEPRIPMHAPCFGPTGERLGEVLAEVAFQRPRGVYIPNVRAELIADAEPAAIRQCLVEHVFRPVHWRASIDAIDVPAPWFVEVGPRAVLHNLFGKDWMPGRRAKTDAQDGWRAHLDALAKELADG
jgi:[acyl-carrier-protein] S-malonyltransferase